eukprot:SAG11_NODE_106_length_16423_cov_51.220840_30_plen_114_part_00
MVKWMLGSGSVNDSGRSFITLVTEGRLTCVDSTMEFMRLASTHTRNPLGGSLTETTFPSSSRLISVGFDGLRTNSSLETHLLHVAGSMKPRATSLSMYSSAIRLIAAGYRAAW